MTVLEVLKRIPNISELAITRMKEQRPEYLSLPSNSFSHAINRFNWQRTKEGHSFWENITSALNSSNYNFITLPPLDSISDTKRIEAIIKEHLQRASENVDYKEDNPNEIDRNLIRNIEIRL